MGEFWDSLHVCNRKTKSNKCNEMDAAIHCWTFPFDVVHTKPGLHRDPPKQHTLYTQQGPYMDGAQGACPKYSESGQHPGNPSSVSPDITLHSRTNQTLTCLSTPSLAVVNTKPKQSDENWWGSQAKGSPWASTRTTGPVHPVQFQQTRATETKRRSVFNNPNRRSFPQQDAHRYGLKPKTSIKDFSSFPSWEWYNDSHQWWWVSFLLLQ